MEDNNVQYDFRNVPVSWQLCFLEDCPMKDKCLRHMVGSHLSTDRTFGPSIYPTMKRGKKGCRLFATGEPKRMAWGFTTLFYEVKTRDEQRLRNSIKDYLGGHSTYYRYNSGDRLLTPEQQAWIIRLFQKHGYKEGLVFDHYTYVYDYQ